MLQPADRGQQGAKRMHGRRAIRLPQQFVAELDRIGRMQAGALPDQRSSSIGEALTLAGGLRRKG